MTTETNDHTGSEDCACVFCRLALPFQMPEAIPTECLAGNIVLFVGAGASTESTRVLPQSFYEDVCRELGLDPSTAGAFPDVMSQYVSQPNGRRLLLRKIRDRLTYLESFSEIRFVATRFHRELSTLYLLNSIVTTNWDEYFERECGAIPFIAAADFAFWDQPGRKVFKIHGSASSYGSVVATREDYDACYERLSTGLLGSSLKMMLATKTIVYVGFSFRDEDFVRLHDLLSREMAGLRPESYIVTLDRESDERFREHRLNPIYTDATFFLRELKTRMVASGAMLPDATYDQVPSMIDRLCEVHRQTAAIDASRYPDVIYSLFYQDGLQHALERILTLRHTGYYSHVCNPRDVVLSYEKKRKQALRNQEFANAAYLDGYMNGHVFFLAPPPMRKRVPLFFLHGPRDPITSLTSLRRHLRKRDTLNHRASQAASKHLRGIPSSGIVLHHSPWL